MQSANRVQFPTIEMLDARMLVIILGGLLLFARASLAETVWHLRPDGCDVPGACTIRQAFELDVVKEGDILELDPGVYESEAWTEVYLGGKSLTVRAASSANADAVVLDFARDQHRGLFLNSADHSYDLCFEGLTFRYGASPNGVVAAVGVSESARGAMKFINCKFVENGERIIRAGDEMDVTLDECSFVENTGDLDVDRGVVNECSFSLNRGNMHLESGRIEHSTFYQNYGLSVGEVAIKNCDFVECSRPLLQKAIWVDGAPKGANVEGCSFVSNTGPVVSQGYGAYIDCTFQDNHSAGAGGALFVIRGPIAAVDCVFERNTSSLFGGAMAVESLQGQLQFLDCVFRENSATRGGGALALGDGGSVGSDASILIERALVAENVVDHGSGAGIRVVGSESTQIPFIIKNTTVAGNAAVAGGAAIAARFAVVDIQSSIIASNGAASIALEGVQQSLDCVLVHGNAGGDWIDQIDGEQYVGHNLNVEPLFCGVEDNRYLLAETSPCLPSNSSGCGLIGAFDAGCLTNVRTSTWGRIKAAYLRR